MNQGPRYVRLMEKSRGQKSRATVPLSSENLQIIIVILNVQTDFSPCVLISSMSIRNILGAKFAKVLVSIA
jgi:hypothetical protein